jgi:hypothetical protein
MPSEMLLSRVVSNIAAGWLVRLAPAQCLARDTQPHPEGGFFRKSISEKLDFYMAGKSEPHVAEKNGYPTCRDDLNLACGAPVDL